MKTVCLKWFFILMIVPLFSQNIVFFREDLNFKLEEDRFYVDGLYYFQNVTDDPIHRTLFYPFPIDSIYGKIDSVFVVNPFKTDENTDLKLRENGASFSINIDPDSSVVYRIGYQQELKENQAEYILTTTQSWGKPFKEVNYSLNFPKYLELDSLSYMPDSLQEKNHRYILFWHKENFMPDRNFFIRFSK